MLVVTRGDTSAPGPAHLRPVVEGYGAGRARQPGLAVVGTGFRGAERHSSAHGIVVTPAGLAVVSVQEVVGQSGYLFAPAKGSWTVGGQVARLREGGSNPCAATDAAVKAVVAALRRGGIDPGYVQSLIAVVGQVSGVAQPETERGSGVVVVRLDEEELRTGIARATVQTAGGLAQLWTSADVLAAMRVLGVELSDVPIEAITTETFPYSPYVLRPTSLDDLPFPDDGDLAPSAAAPATRARPAEVGSDTAPVSRVSPTASPTVALAPVAAPAVPPPATSTGGRHALVTPATDEPDADDVPSRRGPLRWVAALAVLALLVTGVVFGARALFGGGDDDTASPSGPVGPTGGTTAATTSSAPPSQTVGPFTLTTGTVASDNDCAVHARDQIQQFLAGTRCTSLTRALYLTTSDGRQIVVSVADVVMPNPAAAGQLKNLVDGNNTGNINTMMAEGTYPPGFPAKNLFAGGQAYASSLTGKIVRVVEAAWADGTKTADGDATEQAADAALAVKLEA